MTDELDQEPALGQEAVVEAVPADQAIAGDAFEGFAGAEVAGFAYPGEGIVHRITHPDPLGELKDAAKWGYHKIVPEKPEPEPEPGGIVIDIPSHEEVTMRSTWVEHDDPPPPPPEDEKGR